MNTKFLAYTQNVRQSADYIKKRFPDFANATTQNADELCEGIFVFREHWEMERTNIPVNFPKNMSWELMPAGDPEWIFALNRHTSFVILGKAYLYSNNEKYAQRFAELANDWLENAVLSDETKEGCWRSLETGLRCENWIRAMSMFKDSPFFTGELKERMEKSLKIHAEFLTQASDNFHLLSNWGVLQDHGLLLLGLYFNDIQMANLAASRLCREIHMQVFRDGAHWEQSPMYHCEVLHCFLDSICLARQNNYELPAELVRQTQDMARALAKWVKPNGHLPCQSDSDDINARDLLATAALLFNDGFLKAAAAGEHFEENIWDFGTEFYDAYCAIKQELPQMPSCALPDSGNYFLRTDNSPLSVWLRFHCGCLGSGHGHADQLHADIFAYGEDILVDCGRYTYVDGDIHRKLKSPTCHNITRVDGVNFSVPSGAWSYAELALPVKGEYYFSKQADFVRGAHLGYLENLGVFTSRKIVFIKPDIFVFVDEFYTSGNHSYEQIFHFSAQGKLHATEYGAYYEGKKAEAKIIGLGGEPALFSSSPSSREYNALEECAEARFTHSDTGFASMITVISTAQKGLPHSIEVLDVAVRARTQGKTLDKKVAQGIEIIKNGKKYTLLICHTAKADGSGLLGTEELAGYGKIILYGEGIHQDGLVLEW